MSLPAPKRRSRMNGKPDTGPVVVRPNIAHFPSSRSPSFFPSSHSSSFFPSPCRLTLRAPYCSPFHSLSRAPYSPASSSSSPFGIASAENHPSFAVMPNAAPVVSLPDRGTTVISGSSNASPNAPSACRVGTVCSEVLNPDRGPQIHVPPRSSSLLP